MEKAFKGFTVKDLEKLECSTDEIGLIMEYQKRLPILMENYGENGFCVNARDLWVQLDRSQGRFADFVKRRFVKRGFVENVDFTTVSQICDIVNGNGGYTEITEYLLTLDMAKQLAMIENNELGVIARRYFISLERMILRNKEWWKIRNPEKYEYNKMCEELNAYTIKNHNREADHFDCAREAELLNVIVTGKKSAELRILYRVDTCDALRDSLRIDFNDQLLFLETQNQVLLLMNLPYEEREVMLTRMYNVKFNR